MDDLLVEFLTETGESLDQLDMELVKLEQDPNDPGLLGNIFRLVHTIKGTCGFLGLPRLESVAHAGENILGKFRDGEITVNEDGVTLILECLDQIKELLAILEDTEAEPEGNDAELIKRLNAFADSGGTSMSDAESAAPEPEPEPEPEPAPAANEPDEFGFVPVPADQTGVDVAPEPAAEEDEHGFVPVPAGQTGQEAEAVAPEPAPPPEPAPAAAEKKPAAKTPAKRAGGDGDKQGAKDGGVANQTIRVHVGLLEDLMTSVSELVLSRNQLLQMVRHMEDSEFAAPLQRLNHITTELQESVMKTRMQPIGNAWAKLPRIVRDLALELDKKIELKMVGADTELDRQVLELIKDPLTHMVRNSADHGLESPADRVAAGKPETGVVTLRAFHEGGQIIIQIKDDGNGVSVERVRAKVLENGLATESQLDTMSDDQIQQYIFNAGLSTATAVTNVSGRGVGMDVVRTNIEKIGGTVEMKSIEGTGSTFTIKIPLTLAIVQALIVEVGGERFAMPQISVIELVRASPRSEHRIEKVNETPVLRLRDRLLPLITLSAALNLDDGKPIDADSELFIIVVNVGAQRFGVIVDRVFDTEEIVVKPTSPILRNITLFSGNTILGDGSVVMILDPNGLSGLVGDMQMGEDADTDGKQLQKDVAGEDVAVSMLLFEAAGDEPKAVPLSLISRLEEVDLAKVESSSGLSVIQYRGELMPLVLVDGSNPYGGSGIKPVLVFADEQHKMGLVVDQINDIVEEVLNIEYATDKTPGFIGGALLDGRTHTVLDIAHFLNLAYGDWYGAHATASESATKPSPRVLLVDDSQFFRNLVQPLLRIEGYDVEVAENVSEALARRDRGQEFDLIISDIEMPGADGFEFARECRGRGPWQRTPMIALSAYATPENFDMGRSVGFDDFVAKFDRDTLMSAISKTIASKEEVAA